MNHDNQHEGDKNRPLLGLLRKDWRRLLVISTLGFLIAYFTLPLLFSSKWIRIGLKNTPLLATILIVLVALLVLLVATFQTARSVWKRYRHNYTLRTAPFTYLDAIVAAFALVILCAAIFAQQTFSGVEISATLSWWFVIGGIAVAVWAALVMYLPNMHQSVMFRERRATGTYFGDDPIVGEDDDLLGRKDFVRDVYDRIVKYDLSESHVFGLHGAWGEGKTSVLNLLKGRLRNAPQIIVAEFDPWYFPTEEAIIRGFFETLDTAINKSYFVPDLNRVLSKYGDVLESGISKLTGIEIGRRLRDAPVARLREQIQQRILQTEKRLVILIDDIDRLQKSDDMFTILRLVKLASNFENTIFVLSFDPEIVAQMINPAAQMINPAAQMINPAKDRDFLEKIVQSPIDLPAVEQAKIDTFFCIDSPKKTSQITRLVEQLQLTLSQQDALRYGFLEHYPGWLFQLFPTLRGVKRFLNGVYIRLPRIKNEVHIGDFLMLECVRLFFPRVFNDIRIKQEFYIDALTGVNVIRAGVKGIRKEIKPHIESLLENEYRGNLALHLLKLLFPNVTMAFDGSDAVSDTGRLLREEQRVADPEVFQKYFTLCVPGQDLPDSEVRAVIAGWKQINQESREARMLADIVAMRPDEKLPQMLERLGTFLRAEPADIQLALANTLFRHIQQFADQDGAHFPFTPFHRMRALIFQLINSAASEGAITDCLKQVVDESQSLYVAASAVFFTGGTNLQYHRIVQYADQKNLRVALSERLKKELIQGRQDIFHKEGDLATFVLSRWGECDSASMNDYVFSLLERFPGYLAKIVDSFLLYRGSPMGGRFDYPGLVATYDVTRLHGRAKTALTTTTLTPQDRQTVQTFISHHDAVGQDADLQLQRAVNKANFSRLDREAVQLFEKGEYEQALKCYDEAVRIDVNWDDPHNFVARTRYQRWKCLLELAYHRGEPIQAKIDQAFTEIPTGVKLREIVDAAFPNEPPARHAAEFYNCLYYYLLWFSAASDREAKTRFQKYFRQHVTLAETDTDKGSSWFVRIASLRDQMEKHE